MVSRAPRADSESRFRRGGLRRRQPGPPPHRRRLAKLCLAALVGLLLVTLAGCSGPAPSLFPVAAPASTRAPHLWSPAPPGSSPTPSVPTPTPDLSTPASAAPAPPADASTPAPVVPTSALAAPPPVPAPVPPQPSTPASQESTSSPPPSPQRATKQRTTKQQATKKRTKKRGTKKPASKQRVTKVLTIVEENHSLEQMRAGMPYLAGLARRFAYADRYTAIRHPSLPNYLAIAGGDTFGVTDDAPPAAHVLHGPSVFSQAREAGLTAGTWAESMSENCRLTPDKKNRYAVKHNPWTYFVDDRASCEAGNVGTGFVEAAKANRLPNVGMLIPNTCHDAHDGGKRCGLSVADDHLQQWLPPVLASRDFTSGKLVVVITADEDDHDDGNRVLTVVLHASLDGSGRVVSKPLNHYSLSRLYSQVVGAPPLRKAADAPDLAAAFRLPVKG